MTASSAAGERPEQAASQEHLEKSLRLATAVSARFLGEARLSRRLILHIAALPRIGPDDLGQWGHTQPGIAEALMVTQGAVAKVVRRLGAAGALEVGRRHVVGEARRLKVYTLTWSGEILARELHNGVARILDGNRMSVTVSPPVVEP